MINSFKINSFWEGLSYVLLLLIIGSCSKESINTPIPNNGEYISSVDLSSLPQIESTNAIFYNTHGEIEDVLTTLKNNGVNTVRLRIWNNPVGNHSSFDEVKTFSKKIKSMGLKVWLTVHYSDTWAHPGQQAPPSSWQGISYNAIKDSLYQYTKKIITEINPDFIQIGNEINTGLLFPYGNINSNEIQFLELLATGIQSVRENSNVTKIIIQYAGINGSSYFYNKIKNIDYDIIGLSYYPIWHGKSITALESSLNNLSQSYDKEILIAETSYPFTLGWNDWTNNIVGLESQLILPNYPATPQGQKDFINEIKKTINSTNRGIGFCYWGGELIAFNGKKSADGSTWENQALYDFDNKALPVISEFTWSP